MAILLGLVAALMFGLLDIFIAQSSRTIGMMYTVVLAHATVASILLFYLFAHTSSITFGMAANHVPELLWAGLGLGIVSCLSNLSLYKGLSLGPMALISPMTASYGLITVSLAVIFLHERPSPAVGLVLVLILGGMLLATSTERREKTTHARRRLSRTMVLFFGIASTLSLVTSGTLFVLLRWLDLNHWLVLFCSLCEAICMFLACSFAFAPSFTQMWKWWPDHHQQAGLLFGGGAMFGFGIEYFLLSLATTHLGPIAPVALSRLCSTLLLLAYARHQGIGGWGAIPLKQVGSLLLIGLLDLLGTVAYTIGSGQSTLLVATLSSAYPLLPCLVGIFWYRERIGLPQWSGVSLMVIGMIILPLFGR